MADGRRDLTEAIATVVVVESGSDRELGARNVRDRATADAWNDPERIAAHRAMSAEQRLALALEASRAALRFAHGERVDGDRG